MSEKLINKQKIIDSWLIGSDDDYDTMIIMYETKRYNWSLFLGHLMLEKLLKAYFVRFNESYPPFTHNLLKLANDCSINITDELKVKLTTITAFNINARYDDYKRNFYKKCTYSYTTELIAYIKEIREWIKKQMK